MGENSLQWRRGRGVEVKAINFALTGHRVGEQLNLPPIPLSFAPTNMTRLVIIKFIGSVKWVVKRIVKTTTHLFHLLISFIRS